MRRKSNVALALGISLVLILSIQGVMGAVHGEGLVERLRYPANMQINISQSFSEPVTVEWYLDSSLVKAAGSYITEDSWNYTWNTSQIGWHNVTSFIADAAGNTNFTTLIIYIGTSVMVPNGTTEVNATTLSVLTAPGEQFNLTTEFSPAIIEGPPQLCFQGSSTGPLLLQPNEQGEYGGEWIDTIDNTSFIIRLSANNSNSGTFIIGLYRPVAEDEDGNNVSLNIVNGLVTVSPRYDVNGDYNTNVIDFAIVRNAIYRENVLGDPNPCPLYAPRCDVNKDGKHNAIDLAIIRANLGPVETV